MSIALYTGRPGTGKTYFAVNDVIKKLDKGFKVYSNIKLKWDNPKGYPDYNLKYWKKLSDLYDLQEGIIFIDEAHVYMNSRRWKGLGEDMERKLAQHRKDGLHIIGTVQNVNRVDVIFRELIDFWYVCEKFFSFIIATEFDIDDDKQKKYPLRKKFIRLTKSRCFRYDTLAKVVK